jgi:hypothetical protein
MAGAKELAPQKADELLDLSMTANYDFRKKLARFLQTLPPMRAEAILRRMLETPSERPLAVTSCLIEGLSSDFARAIARLVAERRNKNNFWVDINEARMKNLGDEFGDHLADALEDETVAESFLTDIEHHITEGAFARLKTRTAGKQESEIEEIQRLAAAIPGPTVRIYRMLRLDGEQEVQGRIGGRAPGIKKGDIPKEGGRKLIHVLTLELAGIPELQRKHEDAAALSLFVEGGWDDDDIDIEKRPFALLPISPESMETAESTEAEAGLQLEPIDVPVGVFDDSSELEGDLQKLQQLLAGGSGHLLGGPLWMHDGPWGANEHFLLQLNDAIIHESINLGDFGDLYVFDDHAEWSSH